MYRSIKEKYTRALKIKCIQIWNSKKICLCKAKLLQCYEWNKNKIHRLYFNIKYNKTFQTKGLKTILYCCATLVYLVICIDMIKPDILRPKKVSDFSTKGQVESELDYYYRIRKTDSEVRYIYTSDILTNAIKILPVIVAVVKKQPLLYITYGGASFMQMTAGVSLRYLIREGRPDDPENKTSFPSGHTLFVLTSTMCLFLCLGYKKYAVVSLCGAVMVAVLRVASNRHHIIDVVAGGVVAVLLSIAVFYVVCWFNDKFNLQLYHKTQDEQDK